MPAREGRAGLAVTLGDAGDCRDAPFGLGARRRGIGGSCGEVQDGIAPRRSATRASTLAAVVSHEHMKRTPVAPTKL